ncbi:hypothetical protein [Bacillus cereus]|uniref:Uncharacterized protein n=1 Tax=Bacillus cereus VD184 TaxID=1053242 RepID=A0A9W5R5V5_BACCE|nr:hypothetical protein [Bacillus cereus]EOQ10153.1 hypothetical protein IKC_05736 [Bacillus cereus VD184]
MRELAVNKSVQPMTLDGKMAENEGVLQTMQTYMKKSLSGQERTMNQHTKQLSTINESVEKVKQQYKEAIQSHMTKRTIREQLQKERYEKAHKLALSNVQLTTEDYIKIEKMVEQVGENVREKVEVIVADEATKRATTRVMYQITSYIQKKLGLRSIEDIPNGLVDQHKMLVQGVTKKKLNSVGKKGGWQKKNSQIGSSL